MPLRCLNGPAEQCSTFSFSQATDNAIGNFIDQYLGAGWLCEPFDLDIKIALLDVPTFGEKAKCSLSDIVENINDFYDNFSKGGWKAWIELTKPQNNFYGALLLAQEEKMKVEAEAQKEVETDAQMGEGFLGQKDCRWWDAAGNLVEEQKDVRGIAKMPDVCKGKIGEEPKVPLPCRVQCQTKNPSTVIKAMANESVTNFFGWINSAMGGAIAKSGPLQVYVQAIANALINRTIKEGLILLKGEPEPLYVPKYGDIGASTSIPEIIDPEQVLQNKTNAATLIGNLDTLNENVETKLLNEQKNNLAVLEGLILPVYSNIIPVLDEIQTACLSTPYSSYIDWADSQKNGIEENIIPDINERISQFKLDISKSIETVNNIKTAIVSIQDYINKAEIWLNVYEKVNGELDNLELKTAETAMNAAENQAIKDTQEVLKEINGSVSSTDIIGLRQEVFDTNIIIITKAVNLEKERGNATWPEPGTLYAELESAQGLKSEANSKLNTCLNWTSL